MRKVMKGFVFGLIILVFLVSYVSAASTKVTIKTLQYHQVEVIVADGTITDYSKIGDFEGDADEYGDFVFNLTTDKPVVNLYVHVKRYSEEIASEKFMKEETGKPIHIELIPEGYENERRETPSASEIANMTLANETLANETINDSEATINTEDSNGKITGFTLGDSFTSKTFYYILGAIVLLVIIFFAVRYFRRNKGEASEIRVRKLSEVQEEMRGAEGDNAVIADAERKIREAQEEINTLKNQDKIKAARRKIMEDEKELLRLKRGG